MKKNIPMLILIILFLYACVPTIEPTQITNISNLETTPSNVNPTEKPTTSTPDPLAIAPEGTTGIDGEMKYIKEIVDPETGEPFIYNWTQMQSATGEVIFEGWAIEKTQKGGIPLLDYSDADLIMSSFLVSDKVEDGQKFPLLTHQDNIDQPIIKDSLSGVVLPDLFNRFDITSKDNTEEGIKKKTDFVVSILQNGVMLPIEFQGQKLEIKLNSKTGFITIVVPFDSLDQSKVPGVTQWSSPISSEPRPIFRSIFLGVDEHGRAIGLIASQDILSTLSDDLKRALSLYFAANAIMNVNQDQLSFSQGLEEWVEHAGMTGNEKVADIIIGE